MTDTTRRHAIVTAGLTALLLCISAGNVFSAEPAVPGYTPTMRLNAKDAGSILRHGDGPNHCDINGAREPTLIELRLEESLHWNGDGDENRRSAGHAL